MSTEHQHVLVVTGWGAEQDMTVAAELVTAGRRLLEGNSGTLSVALLGSGLAELAKEVACHADETYVIDNPLLSNFHADLYAAALTALGRKLNPTVVLMPHDYEGMELVPKVAYRLDGALVTDCQSVEADSSGNLLCTKQVYGGNAVATFMIDRTPGLVTLAVRNEHEPDPGGAPGKIIPFDCSLDGSMALSRSISLIPEQSASLDMAEVIVAGGRGIGDADGLGHLKALADVLKSRLDRVELGASRPLVDAGLFPRTRQIGQTGEKVSPDIYFAVAISGSSQHASGMIESRIVVAVNKNRDAPIFDIADYGVVGAFEDVLPALVAQLEEPS